ncbi:MAG: penicillin-binding protein, partial [Clostridia bacterium]|nr:penicillin-binding protein [Clostridia bacterium]
MGRTTLKNLRILLAAISISAVICVGLIFEPSVKIFGFATLDKNRLDNIKNSLVILDSNGFEISGANYCPITNLNDYTIDAFLCAEDKRFFSHEGIDYYRIIFAAIKNISDRSFSQGASTISQQLIKNTHLTNEKSIKRKVQEIRLSKALERKYTKKEILEMYLNVLYFGNGTYGIAAASQNFFGKDAKNLSIKQSATLAAIINNPSTFSPYKNIENLNKRTNLILNIMKKEGKISENQYNDAISQPLVIKNLSNLNKYHYFVINEAQQILGCTEEFLYSSGAKIYCNIDTNLQSKISSYLSHVQTKNAQIIVIDNSNG